ncbi:MAG: calcium-binding protein [Pseudomonadota bacterium]
MSFSPNPQGPVFSNFLVGSALDDSLIGTSDRDLINGRGGDDFLSGRGDDDQLEGRAGADDLRGNAGEDVLIGGGGDDLLRGGLDADRFVFDPSNPLEGDDVIVDLNLADGDQLVLNAADVLRVSPNLLSASALGDPTALEGADLDQNPDWTLTQSANGFVVVGHPGGTIEIAGLPFDPSLSFADLLPAIDLERLFAGSDSGDHLRGTNQDDLIDGGRGRDILVARDGDDLLFGGVGKDRAFGADGDDVIFGGSADDTLTGGKGEDSLIGESGDDILRGGADSDRFVFDPSNDREGDDVVLDFAVGEDLLSLAAADIAVATPEIMQAIASGDFSPVLDPVALLTALDNSAAWDLSAAAGSGNLLVTHPGGTIEFEGIAFAGQSFVALAPVFDVDALNLQTGNNQENSLIGGNGDDLLNGRGNEDFLRGGDGNDLLIGGAKADTFRFDPSNGNEGDDIIADFNPGAGDKIQLSIEDIIASLEPALLDDGLQVTDLDDSANWSLAADPGGDATVTHTGGTITLAGLGSALGSVTSFVDLTDDPSGLGLDVLDLVP